MVAPGLPSTRTKPPTLDEIRQWPAAVKVRPAALALGVSPAHLYDLIKLGTAPVRTIRVGSRIVVATASILALLEGESVP